MVLTTIQTDLTSAMKAHDRERVDTLRFLISAIQRYEIDTYPPSSGKTVSEVEVIKIIQKQIKTHRESIEAFSKASRSELVEKEQKELKILLSYVPQELTDEEIRTIVTQVKKGGADNFGQLMGMVMKQVAGRASGDRVAVIVKQVM